MKKWLSVSEIRGPVFIALIVLQLMFGIRPVLAAPGCFNVTGAVPSNVDMVRVRAEWLAWYNDARSANGLKPVTG